jgi:hypothetical protein
MKRFAAAVTLMGVSFATAAVPAPLLEFLQQGRRLPTGLLTFAFGVHFDRAARLSLSVRQGAAKVKVRSCRLCAAWLPARWLATSSA